MVDDVFLLAMILDAQDLVDDGVGFSDMNPGALAGSTATDPTYAAALPMTVPSPAPMSPIHRPPPLQHALTGGSAMHPASESILRLPRPAGLGWVAALAEQVTGLTRLEQIYRTRPPALTSAQFVKFALSNVGLSYRIQTGRLEGIPAQGPLIIVANHPYGAADGLVLADLVTQRRADTLLFANTLLRRVPELAPLIAPVDVFRAGASLGGLRAALRHLQGGGALVVFPAGEVSRLELRRRVVADRPWADSVAMLARRSGAAVLPVHIDGRANWRSLLAGLLHPRFRTACLARDLLRARGQELAVRLGEPVPAAELARLDPSAQTAYLRLLSDALGREARPPVSSPQQALAPPQSPALMEQELALLPPAHLLTKQGDFSVFLTQASHIPRVLAEIGRLRELSFRLVGEGTGQAQDLDRFDTSYEHLFVWHRERREVIGAYRLGFTDRLCPRGGPEALYTHTLFDFDDRLIERVGPALELGRSFVRPEWQRNFRSLRLLWSGIAAVLDAHPELRCLFGPVSISASYSAAGRRLMEAALSRHHSDPALQALVRPRTPSGRRGEPAPPMRPVVAALGDPSLLSRVIGRLDPGLGGLPVLVRHYLELKGRFAGFNVDAAFGNTLDGLVFVQVGDIPARTRAKFSASTAG